MATDQHLTTWLRHIHALAEDIGPRGPTTEGERAGSEYCRGVLDELGLHPQVETFTSATSIFVPHLIASAFMLTSFVLYPLAGRTTAIIAAAVAAISLASQLLELGFRDNLIRRLTPKAQSQNIFAVSPAAGERRQDLILVGHVDTQLTPLVFRTPKWVSIYQTFTTVAFVLFMVQVALYTLGAITGWAWIWIATIPSALGAVLLAAMCIQAGTTPFTAGANDNATAAGMVLAMAERFKAQPLAHTRVWHVCTGCEEVQHYGAIDFFRRHRDEFVNPVAVVFEMLGCAGPAWLTKEGIVVPFRSDPQLNDLAEQIAAEHPELGAYPCEIKGGNTEMTDALRVGVPAITIVGQTRDGVNPYWHQVGDTVDKMDPEVMGRAWRFVEAFIAGLEERH